MSHPEQPDPAPPSRGSRRAVALAPRRALRLWTALSLVWLVIAALLNWPTITAVLATSGLYGEPVLTVPCLHRDNTPVRGVGGVDYARDGDHCRFRLSVFRALYPEYDNLTDQALTEDVLRNAGASALGPTLTRLAATFLVPPATLALVLGLGLLWARKPPKAPGKSS